LWWRSGWLGEDQAAHTAIVREKDDNERGYSFPTEGVSGRRKERWRTGWAGEVGC
jgi:hypothetical protein